MWISCCLPPLNCPVSSLRGSSRGYDWNCCVWFCHAIQIAPFARACGMLDSRWVEEKIFNEFVEFIRCVMLMLHP